MDIVEQVLKGAGIRRTQSRFIGLLFKLWLAIPGRINYANLARFSEKNEKTFRNWFAKPMDFVAVNSSLVEIVQTESKMGKSMVLAIDASFIRKSGKHTPELGKYWEGKQGKAVKGLEVSCCALIDRRSNNAYVLQAEQTPATLAEGQTRLDNYARQVKTVLEAIPERLNKQIGYVVGDAYYTKKGFVDAVVNLEKHFVGKLRRDANLKYLYQGKRTGKAGRPKQFEAKVDFKDFSKWHEIVKTETLSMYSQTLYHLGLKRQVQVVCVLHSVKTKDGKLKEKRDLFFSTDTTQEAQTILDIYQARFQIEFCFRDAKQFSGLSDCQSRQTQAIDFHWNMAFLAVNLTRAEQLLHHYGEPLNFVFSMEDAKRRTYNVFFAEKIFRFLPFNETFSNFKHRLDSLLNLGVKAA
jgi:SRSO17 transposase